MDLNIMVMAGTLAAPPEIRSEPNGATLARLLVTVKTEKPRRRVDVLPVLWWNSDGQEVDLRRGDRVWVAGAAQRRFWSGADGKRSRIELVAHAVRKDHSNQWSSDQSERLEDSDVVSDGVVL